jgi:hypothetical protein
LVFYRVFCLFAGDGWKNFKGLVRTFYEIVIDKN